VRRTRGRGRRCCFGHERAAGRGAAAQGQGGWGLASHVLPNFSTVLCVSERLDLPIAIALQMAVSRGGGLADTFDRPPVLVLLLLLRRRLSHYSSPLPAVLLVPLHASMPCAALFSRARVTVTVQQVSVMVTFFKALCVSRHLPAMLPLPAS
jgi:hypothetical protein